jgi:hypothetical protein
MEIDTIVSFIKFDYVLSVCDLQRFRRSCHKSTAYKGNDERCDTYARSTRSVRWMFHSFLPS